ncbi:MAG: SDR family oxidoreductase [Spirochaetaceae bacterium]
MIQNYPELKGKTAIITGAQKGLGRGISQVLGEMGMKLVLTSRSEQTGQEFVKELRDKGIEAIWVSADLQKMSDAKKVLQAAEDNFDIPYLLVNNAILPVDKRYKTMSFTEEVFDECLVGNLRIFHHLSYLVYSKMIQVKKGNIVNISSVGTLRPHRNMLAYDMSKGAMDAFTRGLSLDLAPYGIRVNSLAPGAIGSTDAKDNRLKTQDGIPLGRMGTTEEMGRCVAFLASDSASYITGQTIFADGGLTTQLTPPGIFI